MAILHEKDTETTTLLHVIQAAEKSDSSHFEMIHLGLDNGRDLILVAITGENLDGLSMVMEGLRMSALEAERVQLAEGEM